MTKLYRVNEIFASLQGEGARAGSANIFIRFSGCNLSCNPEASEENQQFFCDTEFVSGRSLTAEQIIDEAQQLSRAIGWVILTGGEPLLQLDDALIAALRLGGYKIALETNGTREIPKGVNYVAVSPKVAEHAIRAQRADELRYVRHHGQGIPRPRLSVAHRFVSPAFDGNHLSPRNLEWCIQLVKENPEWRLSLQQHKYWRIR